MSLQSIAPPLVLLMVMTSIAMVWAVGLGSRNLAFAFAALFPSLIVLAAAALNWRAFSQSPPSRDNKPGLAASSADRRLTAVDASVCNAQLMAFVFIWGGVAMFAVYTLADIWWWHSWQYGLAMLAIGAGLFAYAGLMGQETSSLREPGALNAGAYLAVVQAIGASIGLVFLLNSGKLAVGRVDWPANHIFIVGGLAIIVISAIAAAVHFRLRSDASATSTAINGA